MTCNFKLERLNLLNNGEKIKSNTINFKLKGKEYNIIKLSPFKTFFTVFDV